MPAVNEQAASRHDGVTQACQSESAHARMPPVQRADPNGEDEVEARLTVLVGELFDSCLPERQEACSDLGLRAGHGLCDGLCGPIDGQDVA